MAILQGAEPYLLSGDKRGVLLVHGFTGSPSEMRLLAEQLHAEGYTVLAPRLCGHGTSAEEMSETGWLHWYSAVEDGYHVLRGMCEEISVIGLSMGGLLALKLAVEYPVNKVASLNAPIYLPNKNIWLLPLYRLFRKFIIKKRRKFLNVAPIYSVCYDKTPLASLSSLLDFIKHMDALLPKLSTSLLIMQSKVDHTICPSSANYIYDKVGTVDKKLVWLEKSGHIMTLDTERQRVFQEVIHFLL